MGSKILLYLLLVLIIVPHIDANQYSVSLSKTISVDTVMVMLTSFGFAIIVPSLRDYFKSDIRKLRLVILVGSVIPLLFYVVWIGIIQGVLTSEELNFLANAKNTITVLTDLLQTKLHNGWLITCIRGFTSICAATSFWVWLFACVTS